MQTFLTDLMKKYFGNSLIIFFEHKDYQSKQWVFKNDDDAILVTFYSPARQTLQQLSRTVFGSFKSHCNTGMNEDMLTPDNAGTLVTINDIVKFVWKVVFTSFSLSNTILGLILPFE